MITNQEMLRKMGGFDVIQRTKDGMFNATMLLKQWNEKVNGGRKLDNYFNSEKTKLFISTIMERENLHTPKLVYVKSRASRGAGAGTWMHPMLFVDFAMWINPEFKYDVIKFVYDQMIFYRKEAGDAYKELSRAVAALVPGGDVGEAMRKVAEALNWIVFNAHEKMLRNKHGDEEKQRELFALERKVADLVDEGFITDYCSLIDYLRKLWIKRYCPVAPAKREYLQNGKSQAGDIVG